MQLEIVQYVLIGLLLLFLIKRLMPAKGIRAISTAQLKEQLDDRSKQFIDVRPPAEYKGRHLKGFKNMPLHQLAQKAQLLSKDREVVVICQSGMRSQSACKTLKKLGFKDVTNVKGGMNAWN